MPNSQNMLKQELWFLIKLECIIFSSLDLNSLSSVSRNFERERNLWILDFSVGAAHYSPAEVSLAPEERNVFAGSASKSSLMFTVSIAARIAIVTLKGTFLQKYQLGRITNPCHFTLFFFLPPENVQQGNCLSPQFLQAGPKEKLVFCSRAS